MGTKVKIALKIAIAAVLIAAVELVGSHIVVLMGLPSGIEACVSFVILMLLLLSLRHN